MWAHCTEKILSIHFLSFSSETIAKQQETMPLRFHQSYAVKGTVHKSFIFYIQFIKHKSK